MPPFIDIAARRVGPGAACFIIAEAGVNHNGGLAMARALIDAAAEAGVDAVKFQTFRAADLVTEDAPKARYQQASTGVGESQYAMLRRLELSEEAHGILMADCRRKGLLFLSTPFEARSADLLETLGVEAFKIPSGELTNLPFLKHVASKGKPMIVSTGMANLEEVHEAVAVIRGAGNEHLALLHCVSCYPADPADVNLRAMHALADAFHVPVGFSDHTLGMEVALAAVALGACVIEKHFTLDRTLPGPDHGASLEPGELRAMVEGVRKVESALGDGRKAPCAGESNTAEVARKSLVAAMDIEAGTTLTSEMIAVKRPGTGLAPRRRAEIVGRVLKRAVRKGELFSLEATE